MDRKKIVDKMEFPSIRDKLRHEHKKIVLCHGVFDLLHYGHIEHLREAKEQGDVLVVSVTAAKYVNKGPGRPFFNDEQRMAFLSNIECVDYVLLSEAVTVHEIVTIVQPDVYVKGQEYSARENDVTGNIGSEQEIVEQFGGRIYFTNGEVYSSTKLLNNFFGALPDDVLHKSQELKEKYGGGVGEKVRGIIDDFSKLSVLVVGDVIIDEYVFCKVQGLTVKDAALSTRYDYSERYAGGSLAIARHLANFAGNVALLSMTGIEDSTSGFIAQTLGEKIQCHILRDRYFVTPVKRRYLKQHPLRNVYEKLFSVNYLLDAANMRSVNYEPFYLALKELLPQYDVVVVCDYGHGLLDSKSVEIIENDAKFLAVNCQTNSSNNGMNVITKYHRADTFVVDERELQLPFGQSLDEDETLLRRLKDMLGSRMAWVTLGASGALGTVDDRCVMMPAVTLHVKDTVGAGDAFYSLAALAAAVDMPVELATLTANIAGAIKTNLVGNSRPVSKVDLLKFVQTVLNV